MNQYQRWKFGRLKNQKKSNNILIQCLHLHVIIVLQRTIGNSWLQKYGLQTQISQQWLLNKWLKWRWTICNKEHKDKKSLLKKIKKILIVTKNKLMRDKRKKLRIGLFGPKHMKKGLETRVNIDKKLIFTK